MIIVKELPGMPGEPPFPEQFAPPGEGTFREGYVLCFEVSDGVSWIGNFQKTSAGCYSTHFLLTSTRVVIVANGLGYLIDPISRVLLRTFGGDVMQIVQLDGGFDFLTISNTDVERHNDKQRIWRSSRIAWDGISGAAVSGEFLLGKARHFDDSWHDFKLNLTFGTHEGGAYVEV